MVFTSGDYVKTDLKGPLEDWKGQDFQVFLYFSPFVTLPQGYNQTLHLKLH